MSLKKKLGAVFILLFYFFQAASVNFALADSACIPQDHVTDRDTFFGTLPDTIVELLTTQVFGGIKSGGEYMDRKWDEGMVYKIFMGILGDIRFQTVFYLCAVLLVAYLGFSFALGYSKMSTPDLLKMFLKIAVVIFFTSPTGWETYLDLIVKNVLGGARYFNRAIIASMYNVPLEEVTSPFAPINLVISPFADKNTWLKLTSLFWANGFLFTAMLVVVFLYTIITAILILAKAVVLYATTIIISSLLLSIGPIFAICILFERTSSYFNKWITNLIGIFLQQYLLFLGFFIFCVIMAAMIKGLFYFESCMGTAFAIKIKLKMPKFIADLVGGIVNLINTLVWWAGVKVPRLPEYILDLSIPIIKAYIVSVPVFDIPSDIFSAGALFGAATLFGKFIDTVSNIGSEISGADIRASSHAQPLTDTLGKYQTAATSSMLSAAVSAGTGRFILTGSQAAERLQNRVNTSVAKRVGAGDNGKMTSALKGFSKVLNLPAGISKNNFHSTEKIDKLRRIESLQATAEAKTKEVLKKHLGRDATVQDVANLTDEQQDMIREEVRTNLKENIPSGLKDKEGKDIPLSDEMIDEVYNTKVTKYGIKVGSNLNDLRSIANPTKGDRIRSGAKGAFLKTNIVNRIKDNVGDPVSAKFKGILQSEDEKEEARKKRKKRGW